jgi:[ribosomal protein S5]-alanine N-acetyltransferase
VKDSDFPSLVAQCIFVSLDSEFADCRSISSVMKPPEILETSRLLLRLPTLEDGEPIFRKYAQDPEVSKYLFWRPHENIETTREFMRRCIQCWKDETAFPWIIIRKEDRTLLGMIEMRIDRFRADFGYGIARQYWSRGYTSEAAKVVIEWALKQEGIYRVWLYASRQCIAYIQPPVHRLQML